jgi:uncharacterized protein (DUF885 family)
LSNAVIERLARQYLERTWEMFPTRATEDGEHRYDHLLDDLTDANLDRYVTDLRALRPRLREVKVAGAEDEADRDALLASITEAVFNHEVERPWRRNPLTAATAIPNAVLDLLARDFAPRPARMERIAARLEAAPRFLTQARVLLDEPCPRRWRQMAVAAAGDGAGFLADGIAPLAEGTPAAPRVAEAATRAATALRDFAGWLQETHASRFPEDAPFALGAGPLERKLREVHCLPVTPEQLAATGQARVEQTLAELQEEAGRRGEADWVAALERIKDQHPSPAELLPAYTAELSRLEAFVFERDLASDPRAKVLVEVTPPFLRGFMGYAAYYPAGPFDPYQQGYFWVTPPAEASGLRDHSHAQIPSVAAHEGYPGHHLQMSSVNRLTSVTRRALHSTVMIEGWGLYTEQLMHELGYYTGASRLAQLAMRLFRALRIVLDMQLHTGAITPEEGVARAMSVARLSETTARTEVARYTMTPAQPCSYLVGCLELEKLRAATKSRLGAAFRDRDFHDRVLSYGHMPPTLVARAMAQADTP